MPRERGPGPDGNTVGGTVPDERSDLEVAVTAALGGALLADDLRGRPAAALAVLDAGPPAPLLRGIVHTLAGEPAAAAGHLLEAVGSVDEETRTRAAAWAALAASLRSNAFPGGSVAHGIEVVARWPELAAQPVAADAAPAPFELERQSLVDLAPQLRYVRFRLRLPFTGREATDVVRDVLDRLTRLEEQASASGQLSLAAGLLRAAAEIRHRSGDRDGCAGLLDRVRHEAVTRGDHAAAGACDLLAGDLALAPFSHPLAADLALMDGGTDTSELPWSLEAAEADPDATDLPTARVAYDAAAAAYELAEAPRGLAAVALRRAGLARLAGDHAGALEFADHAAEAAAAAGDAWLARTAQVHALLARVGAGRPTASLRVPEDVGDWGTSTGSYSYAFGLGLVLARAGRQWLVRAGDPDRASTCHALAGRVFTSLDAQLQRSQSLADRAVIAAVVGDTDAAVRGHERALDGLRQRLDDPRFGRDAWRRTLLLGQRLHQLYLAGDEPADIRRSAARLQELLATAAGSAPEDPANDLDHELRSEAQATIAGSELHATLAEGDRARDAGEKALADERYAAALAVADAAGDDLGRAVTLARLEREGEAHEAYRAHEAALEAQERTLHDDGHSEHGVDAPALPDWSGGRLRRAAAFLTRIRLYDAAAQTFDDLDAREPGWWRAEARPWELLSDQGHVCEQLGELDRAAELHALATETLANRARNVARDEAKTALYAGSGRVFGRAARTALRLSEPQPSQVSPGSASGNLEGHDEPVRRRERSFLLVETGRARALAELLAPTRVARRAPVGGAAQADPIAAWMAASAQATLWQQMVTAESRRSHHDAVALLALEERLHAAELELAAATDVLRADAPDVAHAVAASQPLDFAEVRAALTPGSVLVTHLVVDDDLLTYAVTPEGIAVAERREIDARELARTLIAFADGCATGGSWVDAGRAAARVLLDPVSEVLEHPERLTFVPTGVGHAAPFHALPWGDGVLLDLAPVALLPSAATLPHLSAPASSDSRRSLVVGDPEDMVLRSLSGGAPVPQPPLPFARAEAMAVARWLTDPLVLTGADATAAAVRQHLSAAAMVHLATHAHVDADVPAASALLLARGDALRVVDLVGERLVAELVVLSACESGRGRVTGGDEVLGMSRALLAAGATSAVVSLWPVDDVSTSLVMTRFVASMARDHDPATALREAQRWYRSLDAEGHRDAVAELADGLPDGPVRRGLVSGGPPPIAPAHPYHWAPFTYVGAHRAGSGAYES